MEEKTVPTLEALEEVHQVVGNLLELAKKDPAVLALRPTQVAPFTLKPSEVGEKVAARSSCISSLFKLARRMEARP